MAQAVSRQINLIYNFCKVPQHAQPQTDIPENAEQLPFRTRNGLYCSLSHSAVDIGPRGWYVTFRWTATVEERAARRI